MKTAVLKINGETHNVMVNSIWSVGGVFNYNVTYENGTTITHIGSELETISINNTNGPWNVERDGFDQLSIEINRNKSLQAINEEFKEQIKFLRQSLDTITSEFYDDDDNKNDLRAIIDRIRFVADAALNTKIQKIEQ